MSQAAASELRDKRIVELFRKDPDLSRRAIAERIGCDASAVTSALKRAGLFESRSHRMDQ